jgi:hypothetical protein
VTVSVDAERLDSFGGRLVTLGGRTRLSPGSHLSLELGFTHDRVTLPMGAITAEVTSLRAVYAFTTRLFVSALVQHNSLDHKLVTNLRLGFIHRPGSDLFVVFNEDRGDGVTLHPVAHRGFAMKLSYLARF